MVYHSILNIVPGAMQSDLVVYPSYRIVPADPKLRIHPPPHSLSLGTRKSVLSLSLLLLPG